MECSGFWFELGRMAAHAVVVGVGLSAFIVAIIGIMIFSRKG